MKTIRVETVGGGVFILKECTAFGENGIAHRYQGEMKLYIIEDGDKLTEI